MRTSNEVSAKIDNLILQFVEFSFFDVNFVCTYIPVQLMRCLEWLPFSQFNKMHTFLNIDFVSTNSNFSKIQCDFYFVDTQWTLLRFTLEFVRLTLMLFLFCLNVFLSAQSNPIQCIHFPCSFILPKMALAR